MKTQGTHYWPTILIITILFIASCSKSSEAQEPEEEEAKRVIDPELVGTWSGTLNGSFGEADMTMTLAADGIMTAEGSTSLYCPIEAEWEIAGGRFKAKGNDECDGTAVSFDAARSKTKLTGSWSASSGNSGTFTAEKQ